MPWQDINNSPNSPWRKFGTCFGENNKGVHTYFGCGGNTTCIHSDPSENLLMVVMGEKFMDIYPPCDAACALLELSIRSAEVAQPKPPLAAHIPCRDMRG